MGLRPRSGYPEFRAPPGWRHPAAPWRVRLAGMSATASRGGWARLGWAALAAAAAGLTGQCAPALAPAPANPAGPALALVQQHCGKCHDGALASAVPGALAVFNLAEDPWHARMDAGRWDQFLGRFRGMNQLSAEQRAQIEAMVRGLRG